MNDRVALIDWSHLLEDFLDNIGLTIEQFCQEMAGGWLFGYIEALKKAGIPCVLFCFTARIKKARRVTHLPTGTAIWLLPSPKIYRFLRRRILNPYTNNLMEAAGILPWYQAWFYALLLPAVPYLCTPLWALGKSIKQEGCTHILCQDYEHPRFDLCVGLGLILGLPVYASFQGGNWQLSKWEKWVRPLALANCAGLIVASQTEIERLKSQYRFSVERIAQIFNPIDLRMWNQGNRDSARAQLQLDPQLKIAIWHGRIDLHRKGLDLLLEAWAKVVNQQPAGLGSLHLYILGDGNDHVAFADLLKKNPQPTLTWVARYVNDRALIATWLKAADLYIFPSRHEGFPVAPIEALACGLPLVACAASGIPEILAEGEQSGGIIVPLNDHEALTRVILEVLGDDGFRLALGKKAQHRAQNAFSLEKVGVQLQKFMNLA